MLLNKIWTKKWCEFSVDLLLDSEYRPISIVPRYRQVIGIGGEVVKSETFESEVIREDVFNSSLTTPSSNLQVKGPSFAPGK